MDLPDGLAAFTESIAKRKLDLYPLLNEVSYWVHPKTFQYMPIWYPEFARKVPLYQVNWTTRQLNNGREKFEGNVHGRFSLLAALGQPDGADVKWTCCHIWGLNGIEDNPVVKDHRFYSCVGNMLFLPTPFKALSDSVPAVKALLRVMAYNLYGWMCDHGAVREESVKLLAGTFPEGYLDHWPRPGNASPSPQNVAPFDESIQSAADIRILELRNSFRDSSKQMFPREKVGQAMDYWSSKIVTGPAFQAAASEFQERLQRLKAG